MQRATLLVVIVLCVSGTSAQNCDFESSVCNYKQDKTDNFDWRWYHGATDTKSTGPAKDHTPKSNKVKTIGGNSNGADCVFPFRYLTRNYSQCTAVAHSLLWCATTSDYSKDGKWGNCVPDGVYSLGCYLTYNGNHIFRVTLPGTVRGTNVIQQCITEAKTFKKNNKKNLQGIGIRNYGSYYRCYADEEADLRYNKHGPSLNCGSQGLGTQNTNTTSVFLFTGRYMYVEVNGKQNGDIARISSPLVSVSQKTTKCLKFWYHMYGPHIASLNVYANTTSLGFPIWSKNGTQGNKWKLAKVDVVMSQSYSLVFEGTAEGNDKGDIALDDIQLATGSCDYSGDPCNFQDDSCSFTQDNTDNFDWVRTKGSTPTPGTGPTVDHSYGSSLGYYMLLEASGQNNGDKARIMRTYKKATVTKVAFSFGT